MLVIMSFMLTACEDRTQELAFDTVESARIQANENSEYNAKSFRSLHPEYQAFSISMRGDSTQSAKCGQGDGWATIDLMNIDKGVKSVIKCSTVSAATGCMTEEDFKSRVYAAEDGKCSDVIPFPLPKIQK